MARAEYLDRSPLERLQREAERRRERAARTIERIFPTPRIEPRINTGDAVGDALFNTLASAYRRQTERTNMASQNRRPNANHNNDELAFHRTENDIRDLTANLARYKTALDSLEAQLEEAKEQAKNNPQKEFIAELRATCDKFREASPGCADMATVLLNYFNQRSAEHSEASAQARVQTAERAIARTTSDIATVTRQLERLQRAKLHAMTAGEMKQQIESCEHVVPGSFQYSRQEALVSFKLDGIFCTPDDNPFKFVNDGKPVSMALAPTTVSMRINQAAPSVKMMPGPDSGSTDSDGRLHHPHILSGNSPCFGDFEQAIYEALTECDVRTFVSLCVLYLSQAATGDGAGYRWIRAVHPYLQLDSNKSRFVDEVGREFKFVLTDAGVFETVEIGRLEVSSPEWREAMQLQGYHPAEDEDEDEDEPEYEREDEDEDDH